MAGFGDFDRHDDGWWRKLRGAMYWDGICCTERGNVQEVRGAEGEERKERKRGALVLLKQTAVGHRW